MVSLRQGKAGEAMNTGIFSHSPHDSGMVAFSAVFGQAGKGEGN